MTPNACWPVDATLAECPHWVPGTNELLWIDIVRPSVNSLDINTGQSVEIVVPAKVGSAVPGTDGTILLAMETGLWLRDPEGGVRRRIPLEMGNTLFNDGKCDAAGRFWVGSRSNDGSLGKGSLYRLASDGALDIMATGFDVCNGLGWSPDAAALYIVDTIPRLLYRYDFDLAAGKVANRRVICDFADTPGKPDGLAVDLDGNIWCAMWDGSGIQILSPDGSPIGWVDTPCPRPTSCAFGGDDGRTLFVTSASLGLDAGERADFGLSGQIMSFRAPIAGVPVASYGVPLPPRYGWG